MKRLHQISCYEVENAIEKFKTCCNLKIPQSLGVIDGTHIYIKTPQCDTKYDYFCRKQRYPIAVVGGNRISRQFAWFSSTKTYIIIRKS